jgi:hypothetical protein
MEVVIGKTYRNKKHGTFYHVLEFTRHSETLETLVKYERVEPEAREDIPYSRPMELFRIKFEELK